MAETLGVAASGIAVFQVATQVGTSIIKLKQLWDDLRDAPSSIRDLLNQIECLDPAIWEADHTFSHANLPPMFWDNSIAKQSTEYCHKALNSLTEVVEELALQINGTGKLRRKVASAKVVLKKEQLNRLERRLQNAAMMLNLAQQSYLLALTRIQPHIIIQGFTEIAAPLIVQSLQNNVGLGRVGDLDTPQSQPLYEGSKSVNDCEPKTQALTRRRYPNPRDATSTIRFRLPTWLYRTTWELQSSGSYGDWKFNLRCYRTVPSNSEVLYIARSGDPKDLEILFASGQGSLYDRDAWAGFTLLHFAVFGENWPMIKYLLSVDASPFDVNEFGNTPVDYIWDRDKTRIWFKDWDSTHDFYTLCEGLATLADYESKTCTCHISITSMYHLKIFQGTECPWHETSTLASRLRILRLYSNTMVEPAKVIPTLLQPYWNQDLAALCKESMETYSLIHMVAGGLGEPTKETQSEWAHLIGIVIRNTQNVHHIEYSRDMLSTGWFTPLMTLIGVWVRARSNKNLSQNNLSQVGAYLELWLSAVRSSGYDLEEYGRRENELLVEKGLNLTNFYIDRGDFETRWGRWGTFAVPFRLRAYEYGPEPKDWKVLWSVPEKSYAADFWSLVEDGPQLVPGAWVEDSDKDEDEVWLPLPLSRSLQYIYQRM
ncbi:hypothetical protein GGR51DRAFT_522106 [Nemania sp. FL0031]|nr:hypothetical protein GGR51DRAFT_522106 [Nemania sp. FL0031]